MNIALHTEKLTKRYGAVIALDALDLDVRRGEVLGYLGPNGAGKTTTIRAVLGLIKPTSGRAEIFGVDVHTQTVESHKRVAYVPGEAAFWPGLTGMETLHLLGRVHGSVDVAFRDELIKRFDFDSSRKVRTYSKGNRQKISLIAALATRAELMIMDEPTSGLDPIMEQAFRHSVVEAKERGQTIFLSSHILEELEALCDRVGILRAGRLVELGTLAEMRHLSALTVEATFAGAPPSLEHVDGVSNVVVEGTHVTFNVRGAIDPVLHAVADHHPLTFLSRQPSLEELFLALYGSADGVAAVDIE